MKIELDLGESDYLSDIINKIESLIKEHGNCKIHYEYDYYKHNDIPGTGYIDTDEPLEEDLYE